MLLDPVGIPDIARRVEVRPDTVKKWIDRYDHFPPVRGKAGRTPLREWAEVHRWLVSTRRAPQSLRYREDGGPNRLAVQSLDGDDRWRTIAIFHASSDPDSDTAWTPRPTQLAIEEMGGDRAAAQEWAHRLLQGWDEARAQWVRDHPDELMPAHLVGGRIDVDSDPAPEEDAPQESDPAPGEDERDPIRRAKARITQRWALGLMDDQTYQDTMADLEATEAPENEDR